MTDTPIHHWTMDNISGTSVLDEIAGGTSLTLSGRTQVAGKFGYGLSGGDTSKTLGLPADTAFKAVSLWIRRPDVSKLSIITHNAALTKAFAIRGSADGNFVYASISGTPYHSNLLITNTNWHHLWIVEGADSNHHWFWLDGVKSSAAVQSDIAGAFKWFGRGNVSASQDNVEVDNIQWYDRIPTDDEIAYLAATTSQATTLPLPVTTTILAALDQPYGDIPLLGSSLEQLYSMVLEIWLSQFYGDVRILSKNLAQPYSGAAVLKKSLQQKWGHALQLDASLVQDWAMPDALESFSEQQYGIAAEVLNLTCEQLYHINANYTLFAGLVQPYALAGEAARLYQFDTRLYIDGERIPYHSINWEATDAEYAWSCDFALKDRAAALKCVDGAAITITSAGDTYQLKCYGGWFLDKRHAGEIYRVEGYSRTKDLDLAQPLLGDLPGNMASAMVAELAAPFGITVDWQMADGYLADGVISANNETPLAVIRRIVEDAGGIVQTTNDGNLLIVAAEEVAIPDYPTVAVAETINARLERISTSEQKDEQRGYNWFSVSDQLASGDGYSWDEVPIDGTSKEVRLFVTPLGAGRPFVLDHRGGSHVTIEPFGLASMTITDEQVVFEAGSGQTSKPVYGISEYDWQEADLGAIKEFTEEGVLTATVADYSLLNITYQTQYYRWIVRDRNIEDVQVVFNKVVTA